MVDQPYECLSCGGRFGPPLDRCPHCGNGAWNTTLQIVGLSATVALGTPGIVTDSQVGDAQLIQYFSTTGTRSTSTLRPDGVDLELAGTKGIGSSGDSIVVGYVAQSLISDGFHVEHRSGDDSRGEDGVLVINGSQVPVQCVTAPLSPKFYQEASIRSAQTSVTLEVAKGWLDQAIGTKAAAYNAAMKLKTILAIDVRHVGVLAEVSLIDSSLKQTAVVSGFVGVCLVGPHLSRVTWLSRSDHLTAG